jgi:predicted SAM-dependent methyltransferase
MAPRRFCVSLARAQLVHPPGAMAGSFPIRAGRAALNRLPFLRPVADGALSLYRRVEGPRRLARLDPALRPLRIVVGAEGRIDPGWIATEQEYLDIADARHWGRYFAKDSLDTILAEHVFEHMTPDTAHAAAALCFEHLRGGGLLRAAVPDGLHPDPAYIEWVKVGGIGPGAYDHKVLYDHRRFRHLFEAAGFRVRMLEYWDEAGRLREADWDPAQGRIRRSMRFDTKERGGFRYSSIILDAKKPA